MTKLEVQQRVLQNGKPLDLNKFSWDEKTGTFSSAEDGLVLDFRGISYCTFKTGYGCTFKTGPYCTFNTGPNCTFNTGPNCTFKTVSYCTFDTGSYCTFDTGSNCTFSTGSNCTFSTGSNCTFKTESDCTFDTGPNCIFNTGPDCIFKTESYCTFNTGSNCTFDTGSRSVVIRRDIFEVIMLEEGKAIKLNGYGVLGYTYVKHVETIEIAGIKYNKAEFEEALKNVRRIG